MPSSAWAALAVAKLCQYTARSTSENGLGSVLGCSQRTTHSSTDAYRHSASSFQLVSGPVLMRCTKS